MKRGWVLLLCALVLVPGLLQANPEQQLEEEARRQTESIRQGGANWPSTETEFFRLRIQPGMIADPVATALLDSFTLDALTKLGFTLDELGRWRRQKWDYYLCDDAMVRALTGHSTKGMADLSGQAIISSHFPHFHELVHLLASLKQKPGATHTLPLIQEGLACLLGGRWGRSPEVVLYSGWVMRDLGMADLSELLTQEQFLRYSGGADAAYPLGAAVCEVVRRHGGWNGVMELNREVSGSLAEVASLSSDQVAARIGHVCGWSGPDLLDRLIREVDQVLDEMRRCGIEPVQEFPEAHLRDFDAPGGIFIRANSGDDRFFKVFGETYPVFLLSGTVNTAGRSSSLFSDHFPGRQYEGQRFGLRCSPEEIALYDYGANQVIALWVGSFTGEVFEEETLLFLCSKRLTAVVDQLDTMSRP